MNSSHSSKIPNSPPGPGCQRFRPPDLTPLRARATALNSRARVACFFACRFPGVNRDGRFVRCARAVLLGFRRPPDSALPSSAPRTTNPTPGAPKRRRRSRPAKNRKPPSVLPGQGNSHGFLSLDFRRGKRIRPTSPSLSVRREASRGGLRPQGRRPAPTLRSSFQR